MQYKEGTCTEKVCTAESVVKGFKATEDALTQALGGCEVTMTVHSDDGACGSSSTLMVLFGLIAVALFNF